MTARQRWEKLTPAEQKASDDFYHEIEPAYHPKWAAWANLRQPIRIKGVPESAPATLEEIEAAAQAKREESAACDCPRCRKAN